MVKIKIRIIETSVSREVEKIRNVKTIAKEKEG